MKRFGKNLVQRGTHYFDYHFAPHAIILMYHRVADLPMDPQLLSVNPQHFDEHLEILRRYAQPMALKELASALQKDSLPRRGVVLTFDDGYVDNLHYAKPLLERHDIPATVFITAGQIGCRNEFWWDELERLFLQPGELPSTLSLYIHEDNFRLEMRDAVQYTQADYEQYQDWHIEQTEDPTPRHQLYRSIYRLLHSMRETERQCTIQKLQSWANQDSAYRPSHRALTAEEIVLLAKEGLIEVGAHTMTHSALASLPSSVQREEIRQSAIYLEEILNHPVDSFAYPHGSYTDETISILKEAGFSCACSSDTAIVSREADVFRLPRFSMRDWNGDEFHRWLKGLLPI